MAFDNIRYKGKKLMPNVDHSTGLAYYQHIFQVNYDGTYRRHACLRRGSWCWQNLRQHPQDLIIYLKWRRS